MRGDTSIYNIVSTQRLWWWRDCRGITRVLRLHRLSTRLLYHGHWPRLLIFALLFRRERLELTGSLSPPCRTVVFAHPIDLISCLQCSKCTISSHPRESWVVSFSCYHRPRCNKRQSPLLSTIRLSFSSGANQSSGRISWQNDEKIADCLRPNS